MAGGSTGVNLIVPGAPTWVGFAGGLAGCLGCAGRGVAVGRTTGLVLPPLLPVLVLVEWLPPLLPVLVLVE